VLKVEEWIRIRELSRKGGSVSEIARVTGRDRKTVRKVLEEEAPKLERVVTKARERKLEPYREYLLRRIDEGCLNGQVLLEEIRKQGYAGKISILRELLTPIRKELVRKREATERFETLPGRQAQVDWGEFGKVWLAEEARWKKLYAFVYTLGYSRALYLEFTTSCDMEHFLSCHLNAFGALGIPETILYDNLKTGILGRARDGSAILPPRFGDFALFYGFSPKYCRPYRARTKGKIERSVRYVRQNFWVRVQAEIAAQSLGLAGLNLRAREWAESVANVRVHGTHGEVVLTRYLAEAPLLGSLDGRPRFDTDYHAIRRVGRDGRLSYKGSLYQVSLQHALSEVAVSENLNREVTIRTLRADRADRADRANGHQKGDAKRGQKGEGGEVIRAELVQPGSLSAVVRQVARQVVQTSERQEAQGQGARGVSIAELLRAINASALADALDDLDEPVVEARDLAVYEEVARAASVG
jgi:transposase